MSIAANPKQSVADSWLTIREASEIVGVSTATLRRWCEAGAVSAHTTLGGHRRFDRATILGLAVHGTGDQPSIGGHVELQARIVRAYRQALRAQIGSAALMGLSTSHRARLRAMGRRMVAELLELLEPEAVDVGRQRRSARTAAAYCGQTAAELGLSLDDALALFVRLRAPFMHELAAEMRRQARPVGEATALLEAGSAAFDQLLPAVVEGHQKDR